MACCRIGGRGGPGRVYVRIYTYIRVPLYVGLHGLRRRAVTKHLSGPGVMMPIFNARGGGDKIDIEIALQIEWKLH